ncbi:MAG: methyl-accepting chemotaxis protein [Eubacteriales bacterium]
MRGKERRKYKREITGSVAKTMIRRLGLLTVLVNFFLLFVVGEMTKDALREKEGDYLQEIVSNISNDIAHTLHEYISVAMVLSQNDTLVQLLEESDKNNPMHLNDKAATIIAGMNNVAMQYPDEVMFVGVMSVAQDGYIANDGDYSDDSFSFAEWDYYTPVLTKQSHITSPYLDTEINDMVVSVCYPVISNGTVLGVTFVDLSIDFVADLIAASHFGETGSSFVLGGDMQIIGHETVSYISQDYSKLALGGDILNGELSNPSNTLLSFTMDGVARMGEVGKVGNFDWTIVTSIDASEFNSDSNEIRLILLALLSGSIIATLVLASVTVSISLKPMKYIQEAMNALSQGDTHFILEYEANNELGALANDLRFTIHNLSLYIDEIKRLLSMCSQGDFTASSDMKFLGDFAEIKSSINDFQHLISSALDGIKATVEQVNVGSNYVATGSQSLSEGAAKQSDSVEELNQSISNITQHIVDTNKNVHHVNTCSHQAAIELKKNNDIMVEMVHSMDEINRTSEGIQKIVNTIEDVAFQTNILALNAAVEAARAGTAGRGFAVVAEEVRNLSTRTSTAVHETTSLIEETVRAVKVGSDLVEQSAKGLQDVIAFVDSYMGALEDITQSSEDQSVAINQISDGIQEITAVLQTNSAISEQSAATSEELASQATVMQTTIEQFKTLHDEKSSLSYSEDI